MNATLSLHDSRMAAEDLQELTAELLRSIRQETELTAKQPEYPGCAGAKGDPITIGAIFLAALSSGTVVALFQVLKSYINRKPTLRFEIKTADGRELKIEAEHLSPEQIAQTMQAVKQLFEAPAE
ncbi:hypothetical protein VU08_06855 [Desulfobulbus sp. F5]|nr:hypothetical protein [Desulfobulbus sp. F5]